MTVGPQDRNVAEQLERAVSVFERLTVQVELIHRELRSVTDRLASLDASIDVLVLAVAADGAGR